MGKKEANPEETTPNPMKVKMIVKDRSGKDKEIEVGLEDLVKGMGTLGQRMARLEGAAERLSSIENTLQEIKDGGSKEPPSKKPSKEEELSERDLESMSRSDFARHLLGKFNKLVDAKITPVKETFETDSVERRRSEAKRELDEVTSKHPDFWDFKDEIVDATKRFPEMSIEEAYQFARTQNPEKAKEVDERAATIEQERKEETESKKERFTGIMPTSGVAHASKEMSAKDAAEAAWEESGMDEVLASVSSSA